jgi:hypothetical protein
VGDLVVEGAVASVAGAGVDAAGADRVPRLLEEPYLDPDEGRRSVVLAADQCVGGAHQVDAELEPAVLGQVVREPHVVAGVLEAGGEVVGCRVAAVRPAAHDDSTSARRPGGVARSAGAGLSHDHALYAAEVAREQRVVVDPVLGARHDRVAGDARQLPCRPQAVDRSRADEHRAVADSCCGCVGARGGLRLRAEGAAGGGVFDRDALALDAIGGLGAPRNEEHGLARTRQPGPDHQAYRARAVDGQQRHRTFARERVIRPPRARIWSMPTWRKPSRRKRWEFLRSGNCELRRASGRPLASSAVGRKATGPGWTPSQPEGVLGVNGHPA